jgi:hypothetical protein
MAVPTLLGAVAAGYLTDNATSFPRNFNISLLAGTNRCAVITIQLGNLTGGVNPFATSVATFNGATAAAVGSPLCTGTAKTMAWYYMIPDALNAGTYNVAISNLPDPGTYGLMKCQIFAGVDTTTPIGPTIWDSEQSHFTSWDATAGSDPNGLTIITAAWNGTSPGTPNFTWRHGETDIEVDKDWWGLAAFGYNVDPVTQMGMGAPAGDNIAAKAFVLMGATASTSPVQDDLTLQWDVNDGSSSTAQNDLSLFWDVQDAGGSGSAVSSVLVRCPYFPTDTMGTKGYNVYQIVGGALLPVGGLVTTGFMAIPNVTNGFKVLISGLSSNRPDGSFSGIVVFTGFTDSLGNTAAAIELQTPPTTNQSTVSLCKIAPFVSTDTLGSSPGPGYQIYNKLGATVGAHVTSGVLAIPGVNNGRVALLTGIPADVGGGFQGTVLWDNGGGTPNLFVDDNILVPPAISTGTPSGVPRTISITLRDAGNVLMPNLTGLNWMWFDQSSPGSASTPSDKGTGASTNSSGVFSVTSVNSTLAPGGVGYLVISNTNGDPNQSPPANIAGGPVTVS